MLLRTVRLLAQVTQQVAIVQYPTLSHSVVRHVEIVSMSPSRLLLILITSTGRIEQRALEIQEHEEETLAELRAHLNAAAVGNTSPHAAVRLSKLSEALPPSLQVIGQAAIAILLEMVSSEASGRMVVGGMPNLTRYGAEFETTVKPVFGGSGGAGGLAEAAWRGNGCRPGDRPDWSRESVQGAAVHLRCCQRLR